MCVFLEERIWYSGQYYSSSKRFNLCIDGLQDAFIKDKVIDIMTYNNIVQNPIRCVYF
jgi:serine/threonine protein phosphatase PrpC